MKNKILFKSWMCHLAKISFCECTAWLERITGESSWTRTDWFVVSDLKLEKNLQNPNIIKFQKVRSNRKKRLASQLAPWPHTLGSGSKQGSRHLNFTQACKKLIGLYFEQKCYSNWLFWKTLYTPPDSGCNRHAWYTQCNTWWNRLQGNLEGTCMWLGYSWPRIKRSHHKLHPCRQARLVNYSFF